MGRDGRHAPREIPFPHRSRASRGCRISPFALRSKEHSITTSFADLGISESLVDALAARGITAPFPIQEMVIENALDGCDLLVQSPTGSGKTLAFGVPTVDVLGPGEGLAALILAPTRELASQIVDELKPLCEARGLAITAVYGGVGFGPQTAAARRADIVVATPGRLEDLIERRVLSLDTVEILVLDEADRMLDMGFRPAVDRIVAQTPDDRQTLFFSATLEGAAGEIAAAYTVDPRRHTQRPTVEDRPDIEHSFVHLATPHEKLDALVTRLEDADRGRTLVFVRTKRGADRLTKRLRKRGHESVAMHGDKTQSQRERALARFERGEVDVLVATDVAARGIDVAAVTHVVNFDAPEDSDAYVHRVGRTGRAGNRGTGISLVLAEQRGEMGAIARGLGLGAEFEQGSDGRTETTGGAAERTKPQRSRRRRNRRKVSA